MAEETKKVQVILVGGSGYGGGELLRLLAYHPDASVSKVSSHSSVGSPVSSVHTHLAGVYDLPFSPVPTRGQLLEVASSTSSQVVVVLALPQGKSAFLAETLIGSGLPPSIRIIDLSGDLRLKDVTTHEQTYPQVPFLPNLRSAFVYGLPEINREEIRSAQFVSNPGCLATAAALALLPFREIAWNLQGQVVIDVKTGTSGAGREPSSAMHHPSRDTDCTPYKVLEHRHEPELQQTLRPWIPRTMFVPHLLPVSRGIIATVYGEMSRVVTTTELLEHLSSVFKDHPSVRVRDTLPRLVDVVGSNFCDITASTRGTQVVIVTALDNLVKGMAGQAIQNMNLMCGLDEMCGLSHAGLGPV